MLRSFLQLSILILFLSSSWAQAQPSPHDEIDFNNFDKRYLEHLTKIKVDSVRIAHGLKPLVNDSLLYVAACDHSNYLLKNNKTGHYQDNDIKHSPQDRVVYYGGHEYLSGENVISSFVHKPVKPKQKRDKKGRIIKQEPKTYKTYDQLATALCHGWVNSPPHFANMRRPHWQLTGLCIELDTESKVVKGTQLFGYIPLKYEFDENKEMFPYSDYEPEPPISSFDHPEVQKIDYQRKLPFKLKAPKKINKKMKEFIQDVQSGEFYRGRHGNTFTLTMFKPKVIEKVFKKKKNGVAIEIVEYKPYHCGNPDYYLEPSRRNKKSPLKGQIIEPIFKKELLKGFDPEQDEMHIADIGVDPQNYTSYPEFNLIFIYKKKIAYVMHFVGACGSPYELYKKQEMYPGFISGPLEFETFLDSATIKVDFKRNQTTLDSVEFQAIRDSVPREQISIHKVVINAFSSIEGSEEINLSLMKQRADNMEEAMLPYLNDSTKIEKYAKENWDLFYEQTKTGRFKKLGTYDKATLKEMLSDTIKRKVLDDMLFEQRVAEIKLTYTSTVKDSAQYILDYYNSLVNNMRYRKKASSEEEEMLNWCHAFLYDQFKKGNMDTNTFINMNIPDYEELYRLMGNHAWAEYETYKNTPGWEPSSSFLKNLKRSGVSRHATALYQYNMLSFFIDKWTEDRIARGSLSPEEMTEVIDSLKGTTDKRFDLTQMLLNFHFKAAYYYFQELDWENRDKSAMFLFQYYRQKRLDDATALSLGRAFTNLRRGDLGAMLLAPYALREDPNHDILALYLKLTYKPVDTGLDEGYYKYLISTYNTLGQIDWCQLFLSECSISFQAFDYEPLRDFYCAKCGSVDNEATKSMKEAMKKAHK